MSRKNIQNVILFKKKDESNLEDCYEQQLKKCNFIPHFVTTLSFEFCNLEQLAIHLQSPQDFSGIIFTSQRSVEAVHKCLKTLEEDFANSLLSAWKKHKTFVVGMTTGEMCRKFFHFNDIAGEECGNASKLTAVIKDIAHGGKPLLFPCGDQKLSTIMKVLPEAGINVSEITVYKTYCHPDLEHEVNMIKTLINSNTTILSFFSPSGVRYVSNILEERGLDKSLIYCAAIGPTTAEAIKIQGLTLCCTASTPNAGCLSLAIASVDQ